MNTPKNDDKPSDSMDVLKQPAACCDSSCSCHAPTAPSKVRRVIGVLVLVAAGLLVVRAAIKTNDVPNQTSAGFVNPVAVLTAAGTNADGTIQTNATNVGSMLGAFSELNIKATDTDAVFIYLPPKEGASVTALLATMKGAVDKIEAQGKKCGLFTLKPDSSDYGRIAEQVSLPAVLAIVKGAGMSTVTGDITEEKLIQGFVAASRTGGCCPSGAGGAGCTTK